MSDYTMGELLVMEEGVSVRGVSNKLSQQVEYIISERGSVLGFTQ